MVNILSCLGHGQFLLYVITTSKKFKAVSSRLKKKKKTKTSLCAVFGTQEFANSVYTQNRDFCPYYIVKM